MRSLPSRPSPLLLLLTLEPSDNNTRRPRHHPPRRPDQAKSPYTDHTSPDLKMPNIFKKMKNALTSMGQVGPPDKETAVPPYSATSPDTDTVSACSSPPPVSRDGESPPLTSPSRRLSSPRSLLPKLRCRMMWPRSSMLRIRTRDEVQVEVEWKGKGKGVDLVVYLQRGLIPGVEFRRS
jgi:hypothetical protein